MVQENNGYQSRKKRWLWLLFITALVILVIIYYNNSGSKNENRHRGLVLPIRDSLQGIPYDTLIQQFRIETAVHIEQYLPPAGDQIDQSSCVPFSLSYYLVSYYEKRRRGYSYNVVNDIPDYSKVFSPAFVFNTVKNQGPSSDCNSGVDFVTAFNFIKNNGVSTWQDFPYYGRENQCSSPPSSTIFTKAKDYIGYKFFRIDRSLPNLKTYLSAGIPIIVGIYSSKNMDIEGYAHNDNVPFFWKPLSSDIDAYHAMLCVGYDESTKCFILINSWGIDWGVEGYCYIPYNIFFYRARELYIAKIDRPQTLTELFEIKDNKFQVNISGQVDSLMYNPNKILSLTTVTDSLFNSDLILLRNMENKSEGQKFLQSELEKYFKQ